ncbi:MAG: glycoside hydrolase family 97 protein [Bacteroidales bacterium]|nr:glycoside hydrolase family 97 protein [Bacteroidales bacterium]
MKKICLMLSAALLLCLPLQSKDYSLNSPSGKLKMSVSVGKKVLWSLSVGDETVLDANRISMTLDGVALGDKAKVRRVKQGSYSEHINAPFYRQSEFDTEYNWLTLQMKGDWSLEFRAYDDGVAYRFVTNRPDIRKISSETVEFSFTKDYDMLVPYAKTHKDDKYRTSFESLYEDVKAGDESAASGRLAFMPVYVDLGDAGNLLLMEADLYDYPGMFLRTTGKGFEAEFPPYPENKEVQNGRYLDYLNVVKGSRNFPWRVVAYAADENDLPLNNMVYQLSEPCKLEDLSWITPGQSTWDWWNDFQLYGVPFKAGINTESYLYDIDVAARFGLEYILVDEGWYRNNDVFNTIPEMDIPRICAYAKERGVKVMLWVRMSVLGLEPRKAFEHYSKLGVAGFKIDFFDSQDAAMVSRIGMYAKEAAYYKLVVDLHGIFKPAGLNKTYPNVLNFEGVAGLENLKWCDPSKYDMPRNDVILPYIRQVSGPMDYTQGALRNAQRSSFRAIYERPMSQGTRAHQVACYVVFDSPLVMLCDSPSDYLREEESTRYISSIPSVFDRTSILSGKIGEWIVTLREKDGVYYVGGLTSWTPRDLEVDFSFLPEGDWNCRMFCDGPNASKLGEDFMILKSVVNKSEKKSVHLAPGGGFAMVIRKK